MTNSFMSPLRSYALTAIAAGLYVFLGIAFADGLFSLSNLWDRNGIFSSTWISYVLLALIIISGVMQARRIPAPGVRLDPGPQTGAGQINDPKAWQLLIGNTYLAVLWLPIRFFVGQEWLAAGEGKVRDDAWMSGGTALQGFWERAVAQPEAPARPAITYDWFRNFLQYMLDHQWFTWFAKLIAIGEVLVGIGLILGALVGIAAVFGTVLNFNFLLAGTVSSNPVLFGLTIFLVLGWKVAGWIGLDRFILPILGTPWGPGKLTIFDRRHRAGALPAPRATPL